MNAINPTQQTYKTLDDAYRFFNKRLFKGKLASVHYRDTDIRHLGRSMNVQG